MDTVGWCENNKQQICFQFGQKLKTSMTAYFIRKNNENNDNNNNSNTTNNKNDANTTKMWPGLRFTDKVCVRTNLNVSFCVLCRE